MIYLASFAFFISFFRISLINNSLYLSFALSLFVIVVLLTDCKVRGEMKQALGIGVILSFIMLFFWSFTIDIHTGVFFGSPNAAFSIRMLSIVLLSVLPAFFINKYFIKGRDFYFRKVLFVAFLVQTFFWVACFLFPEVKSFLYSLMGSSKSVNLRDYNMGTRGFGLSNEINFTTPFLMIFLSLVYLRGLLFKIVIVITQLFNSNTAVLGFILGFFVSKFNIFGKVAISLISFFIAAPMLMDFIPRFGAEFSTGGTRTITALFEDHLFFIGDEFYEYLFGSGVYLFHGQSEINSDIGWVILMNLGGIVMIALFCLFILLITFKACNSGLSAVIWISIAVALNFKGVILGPNAFMFSTFFIMFHEYYKNLNNKSIDAFLTKVEYV